MNPSQKKELLELARASIETKVRSGALQIKTTDRPEFSQAQGVFVTLKIHGRLRGCIGYIESQSPLYKNIQECAISSAERDPRFPPLQATELTDLDIEISVLSPVKALPSIDDIQIGQTGLIMQSGSRRGVLLPQVPVEQGWNVQQFLSGLCQKTGLKDGVWKNPNVKLYYFTAEVFNDHDS